MAARCLLHAALGSRLADQGAESGFRVAAALVLERELTVDWLGGPPEAAILARLQECAMTCRAAWSGSQTARLELNRAQAGGLVAQALTEGLHRRLESISAVEFADLEGGTEGDQAAALGIEVITLAAALFAIGGDIHGLATCTAAQICLEVATPHYHGLLPALADLFERSAESDSQPAATIPPEPAALARADPPGQAGPAGGRIGPLPQPALRVVSRPEPATRMHCLRAGCERPGSWRCAYRDSEGGNCWTGWCEDHAVFIEGTPYCARHAAVARALSPEAVPIGPVRERPAINDRGMAMAVSLGDQLAADLSEALRSAHPAATGATLVADSAVRRVRSHTGDHFWERSWAVLRGADCLVRLDLRVSPGPPETIELRLDERLILSGQPAWSDPDAEARFVAAATDLVRGELQSTAAASAPIPPLVQVAPAAAEPDFNRELLTDFVLRLRGSPASPSAAAIAESLGLPSTVLEALMGELTRAGWLSSSGEPAGPGRLRLAEVLKFGTRYSGPAPVAAEEYRSRLLSWRPMPPLDQVAAALADFNLPASKLEELTRALEGPANILVQGSGTQQRRSLCGCLAALLPAEVVIPVAIEAGGEVLTVFDPAQHRVLREQPDNPRWRGVRTPSLVVRSGERLGPLFDPDNRTYQAPPQTRAACGMLAIELERGARPASGPVLPDLGSRALEVVMEASLRPARLPAGGLTVVLADSGAELWLAESDLARVSCRLDLP